MAKLIIGTDKTVGTPAVVKEVTPVKPYPLLSRVKDDSNNDIGIVVCYHTDASNQKYAVVCLNKQYRPSYLQTYLSSQVNVDGLPNYGYVTAYNAPETATKNCDEILATAIARGLNSYAVTNCRNQSFVIGGVTYYGQLPTYLEMIYILINHTFINQNDPSVSGSDIDFTSGGYWTSTQSGSTTALGPNYGAMAHFTKNTPNKVIPILEIPIS